MHEFPPLFWPPTNYPAAPQVLITIALSVAVLVGSIRVTGTRRNCLIWGLVVPLTWLYLSHCGARVPVPGQGFYRTVSFCLLLIATLQAAIRSLIKARTRNASKDGNWLTDGRRAFIGGLILGTVAAYLFTPPSVALPPYLYPRYACKNNLKQIGLALHGYHDDESYFPLAKSRGVAVSWRVAVLPYLDEAELFSRYEFNEPWDSVDNSNLAKERVSSYDCEYRPRRFDANNNFFTAYAAVTGKGAAFEPTEYVRRAEFTDGMSNTMMVAEACGKQIVWTEPRDVNIDKEVLTVNAPGAAIHTSNGILSSYHGGGAQLLMADGSVQFIGESIDRSVIRQLITRNGIPASQENPDDWF